MPELIWDGKYDKDRAARIWCENAALLTGMAWSYLKVPQKEFEALQATELTDLRVFSQT